MDMRHLETLSSFVDGEAVDPDVLEQALRDEEATPLLVKAVRLRLAVQELAATPDPGARRRCEAAVRAEAVRLSGRVRRLVLVAATAAVVAAAGIAGIEFGARHGPLWGPAPARLAMSRSAEVPESGLPAAAGDARRTLRFDPARNWTEGGSQP